MFRLLRVRSAEFTRGPTSGIERNI